MRLEKKKNIKNIKYTVFGKNEKKKVKEYNARGERIYKNPINRENAKKTRKINKNKMKKTKRMGQNEKGDK